MYVKRKLTLWSEKIYLQWKGLGRIKFLPFIANYIILPIFVLVCAGTSIIYDEGFYFSQYGVFFIPFMSVWWIIMVLQEYVEGTGSEVIRMYDRIKLPEIMIYFLFYLVLMLPLFTIANKCWDTNMDEIILMVTQCVFYLGIAYFMIFTFNSILGAIIPILTYTLFSMSIIGDVIEKFQINDFRNSIGYVVVGSILIILGIIEKKRRQG